AMVNGHAPGVMPPEYAGGIGLDGVAALRGSVEAGGTLFAVDAASTLPIRYLNIPVRDALDGVRNTEFYCPGSLLRMKIDTTQPPARHVQVPVQRNSRERRGHRWGADKPGTIRTHATTKVQRHEEEILFSSSCSSWFRCPCRSSGCVRARAAGRSACDCRAKRPLDHDRHAARR